MHIPPQALLYPIFGQILAASLWSCSSISGAPSRGRGGPPGMLSGDSGVTASSMICRAVALSRIWVSIFYG